MGTDAPLSDISEDSLVQFETAVRMIPQFDPEHPKMISQGPSVCVFNKSDSQEVLAVCPVSAHQRCADRLFRDRRLCTCNL